MKYWLGFLALVLCAGGFFVWWQAYSFLNTAPASQGKEIYFDVSPGSAFGTVAADLEAKGLITDARKFRWLARFKKQDSRLQAGRFALNTAWKPVQVLDTLVNGKPALFRVTIPEGLTWWQTARLLEDAGLARFEDFRQAVFDPAFLRRYGIPFSSAEGFLMPDTYLVKKPESAMPRVEPKTEDEKKIAEEWQKQARSVAGRMIDNFWRKAGALWTDGKPPASALKNTVILASIVEKETGIDAERPRVAGVYANRIAKNMLLQADPTTIYGLGPEFSGPLRRSQLDDAGNPYNTYQKAGLPPGPICSFGTAALKAAINPEKHDYFYFVAKTDGGVHVFSKNLAEHNRAVDDYRRQKKGR